jgi:hypothetical protein
VRVGAQVAYYRTTLGTILSAAVMLLIMLALWAAPDKYILDIANTALIVLAAAFAFSLGFRSGVVAICLYMVLVGMLRYVNQTKVSLTKFPLTSWDLTIALSNPTGFVDAVALPRTIVYSSAIGLFLIVLFLIWRCIRRASLGTFSRTIAAGALASTGFYAVGTRLFDVAQADGEIQRSVWEPRAVERLADRMGVLPFLLFTANIQLAEALVGPLAETSSSGSERAQSDQRLSWLNLSASVKPNIVVVLLESTMDLEKSFDITPPVQTSFKGTY